MFTVPQSAITYTPSQPEDTRQLQTVHSGEVNPGVILPLPLAIAQARLLVPATLTVYEWLSEA